MDRQYEEYRDQRDMTDAEALRMLIRQGLESERREQVADLSPAHDAATSFAGLLAALTMAVGLGGAVGALPLGTALVWGTAMLAVAAAILVAVAKGLTETVDEFVRERRREEITEVTG